MQLGQDQQCYYCRLFCLLSYWLTRSSQLPRPASPAPTSRVETVHPQCLLINNTGWKAFFPLFSFIWFRFKAGTSCIYVNAPSSLYLPTSSTNPRLLCSVLVRERCERGQEEKSTRIKSGPILTRRLM